MCEPLNNKICCVSMLNGRVFKEVSVKSAVKGLIIQIEYNIRLWNGYLARDDILQMDRRDVERGIMYGEAELKRIKKRLPDAVGE